MLSKLFGKRKTPTVDLREVENRRASREERDLQMDEKYNKFKSKARRGGKLIGWVARDTLKAGGKAAGWFAAGDLRGSEPKITARSRSSSSDTPMFGSSPTKTTQKVIEIPEGCYSPRYSAGVRTSDGVPVKMNIRSVEYRLYNTYHRDYTCLNDANRIAQTGYKVKPLCVEDVDGHERYALYISKIKPRTTPKKKPRTATCKTKRRAAPHKKKVTRSPTW